MDKPKPPKIRDWRAKTIHADTGEISINPVPMTKEEAVSCAERFDRFWPQGRHEIAHKDSIR